MVKNSKKKRKTGSSFDSIKKTWGRLLLIGGIFSGGFVSGTYYKETVLMKTATEKEKEYLLEIQELINNWSERESVYQSEIERLRKENMDLYYKSLGHETKKETAK